MKKFLFVILTVFLISFEIFAADIHFVTHSSEEQTFVDEKDELRGKLHAGKRAFYLEVVREMMDIMKVPKVIDQVPLARGMLYVQQQDDYAFFNVSRTPERENTVKWVIPILEETEYFYEMKNAPTGIKTLEDAKKVNSIGVVRGGVHETTLLAKGFKNLNSVTSYKQNFQMLELGRINLTPATVNLDGLKEAGLSIDAVQRTPVVVLQSEGYLCFSKNISDDIVTQWREAYTQVKNSGKFKQLYNDYFLPASNSKQE